MCLSGLLPTVVTEARDFPFGNLNRPILLYHVGLEVKTNTRSGLELWLLGGASTSPATVDPHPQNPYLLSK